MFNTYICFSLFIFTSFFTNLAFAQNQSDNEAFKEKLEKNSVLFAENIDAAYSQFNPLIKEARKRKDTSSELLLLDRKCRYFYSKNKIDSLLVSAEQLNEKAKKNNDIYAIAMANLYSAEAYSINGLYNRALANLEKAYHILEDDTSGKKRIFFAKANVLSSFANVYTDKGEPQKAVAKLKEVIESYNQLENQEEINRFQYLNYSNIAHLYSLYNLDSAKYFVMKSIALKPKNNDEDKAMTMNYYVLGKVFKASKEYPKALENYKKAIQVSEKIGVDLNLPEIYSSLIELYQKTGKKDSIIYCENKLK